MLLGILSSQKKPQPDSSSNPLDTSSSNVIQHEDATAAGSTSAFLDSKLVYTTDEHGQSICKVKVRVNVPKLVLAENGSYHPDGEEEREEEIGVMMGWEEGIMKETVKRLTEGHKNEKEGLKVLNVGFGLGIVRVSSLLPPLINLFSHSLRLTVSSRPFPLHHPSTSSSSRTPTFSHICAQPAGTTSPM